MTTLNRASCGIGSTRRARTRGCSPGRSKRCSPTESAPESLKAAVDSYLDNEAQDAVEEAQFFGDKRLSLPEAVARAAHSLLEDGRLHPHQHRLGYDRMRDCASLLADHGDPLAAAADFAALHRAVGRILGPAGGYGELAIYDIAERIGWYRGLEPEQVYLHSGTRDGTLVLDPSIRGATIPLSALPRELQRLTPAQTENFLCIYKSRLQELRRAGKL